MIQEYCLFSINNHLALHQAQRHLLDGQLASYSLNPVAQSAGFSLPRSCSGYHRITHHRLAFGWISSSIFGQLHFFVSTSSARKPQPAHYAACSGGSGNAPPIVVDRQDKQFFGDG